MSLQAKLASRLHRLARLFARSAEPARAPKGWQPICATDAADIFIVAYPKSGITWLQNMVAAALFGLDPEQTPDCLVQDLVPDVHYKPFYKRYRTPTFFKTHHLPRPEYRRVVYLLRDGRDAMVSYWHHLQALGGRHIEFAEMLTGGALFPCAWHEHVEQWTANPHGADMLTIRYEDLKADPVTALVRLCDFAGESRDRSALERVAEKCSFAAMRTREQRQGWDNPDWPKDRPFVRRGIAGSYRDEMPAESLALFLADAGATLRKVGYC
jgi:Sulfotransferase domain